MADSHVISALSSKRGEILGSIKHYKQLIFSLDKDLQNIDATIKIFEPDYKFGSEKVVNKHTRNRFFNNGEAKVLVLEVLMHTPEQFGQPADLHPDTLPELIRTASRFIFGQF